MRVRTGSVKACMLSLPLGMKRDHSRARPATASHRGSHLPIPRRGLDHMGMVAPLYYTAEMVRTLPEDRNRYETVHGELLVTPAPRVWHQVVLGRVRDALNGYVGRHPQWYMLAAPADISPAPDVLVQPDLFVVPIEEVRARLGPAAAAGARGRSAEPHDGSRRPIHEAPAVPGHAGPRLLDRGPGRALRGDLDARRVAPQGRARPGRVAPGGRCGLFRAVRAGAVPTPLSRSP